MFTSKRNRGRGQVAAGELSLATSLWGMLYSDNAGVVSQTPEHLRKGVIVVVYAAFGLTELEAKTEMICRSTSEMSEATAIFSVEAAGQVYNQTN